MNNEQAHKAIHKKINQTLIEIDGTGKIEEIPNYYGEILFDEESKEINDPNIKLACQRILGNEEIKEEQALPPFLNELLKIDKERLIAQLLEYYTRNKIISKKLK